MDIIMIQTIYTCHTFTLSNCYQNQRKSFYSDAYAFAQRIKVRLYFVARLLWLVVLYVLLYSNATGVHLPAQKYTVIRFSKEKSGGIMGLSSVHFLHYLTMTIDLSHLEISSSLLTCWKLSSFITNPRQLSFVILSICTAIAMSNNEIHDKFTDMTSRNNGLSGTNRDVHQFPCVLT